jgi:Predicted membrane protein
MLVIGVILTLLAAGIQVYIFSVQSLNWTSERIRSAFGLTHSEAQSTRLLAFTQGFHNLFLAIGATLGVVLLIFGQTAVGATLILAAASAMVASALVLLLSAPRLARVALVQAGPPLFAILCVAAGLAA